MLFTSIHMFVLHNMLFTKMAAKQHFRQHQLNLTYIRQPVLSAKRDKAIFSGTRFEFVIADLHHRLTLSDHPMLGAFVMVLQAQFLAWYDGCRLS